MRHVGIELGRMDLVLQGPVYDYTLDTAKKYLELDFVENVIISTWENQNIDSSLSDRIKAVYNKPSENPGITNRNLQIISSLGGLKMVRTRFSAKLRTDQIISLHSMNIMYDYYTNHMDRLLTFTDDDKKPYNMVCVAGIFRPYPLHPRDHIFWGNTNDLIDIFSLPLDATVSTGHPGDANYAHQVRTEAYIAMHYCSKFDKEIEKFMLNPGEFMVDSAPSKNHALEVSDKILTKIFKPFPKIEFAWPKQNMTSYHYDYTETHEGEFFGN